MSVDIGRMRFGPTPWTCSVCGHENPMHMQSCQGCQREPRTTLTDGKQERDEDREHCERLQNSNYEPKDAYRTSQR